MKRLFFTTFLMGLLFVPLRSEASLDHSSDDALQKSHARRAPTGLLVIEDIITALTESYMENDRSLGREVARARAEKRYAFLKKISPWEGKHKYRHFPRRHSLPTTLEEMDVEQ